MFKSNFSSSQIYETLYSKLKERQKDLAIKNRRLPYSGVSIYLYTFENYKISENYIKYRSILALSKSINISRETIKIYLDTFVPFKNYLFFTEEADIVLKEGFGPVRNKNINFLISENKKELNLNATLPKKVFIYSVSSDDQSYDKLLPDVENLESKVYKYSLLYDTETSVSIASENKIVNGLSFDSKEAASRFLKTSFRMISNHIDKWKAGGINGYYLFSKELSNSALASKAAGQEEKEKLIKFSNLKKISNIKVWVYFANKSPDKSLYNSFRSLKQAADHLNTDYRSILRFLDTKKATLKNGNLFLFFSKKLTLDEIKNLELKRIKTEIFLCKRCESIKN